MSLSCVLLFPAGRFHALGTIDTFSFSISIGSSAPSFVLSLFIQLGKTSSEQLTIDLLSGLVEAQNHGSATVKTRIIELCAMKFEIPFSRIGPKHSPFLLAETEFYFIFIDLTERGESDDISHCSIIQVYTVRHAQHPIGLKGGWKGACHRYLGNLGTAGPHTDFGEL